MADMLGEFVEQFGVRIVGGCCGTTPEHLAAIVERGEVRRSGDAPWPERRAGSRAGSIRGSRVPRASSAMRAIDFDQNPQPLLIGERVNSQGSRKVKRLLLADDYEGILDVAREQLESGAHVLDVCVALTERGDEAEQMAKLVKLLSMSVETPLMVDSTEAAVIAARARARFPAAAIINSINMENGRKRIDDRRAAGEEARRRARRADDRRDRHGEDARAEARDREEDLRHRRRRVRARAREDLIYDALTFTLATGDEEWIDSARTRRSRASASSSASCRASSRASASPT